MNFDAAIIQQMVKNLIYLIYCARHIFFFMVSTHILIQICYRLKETSILSVFLLLQLSAYIITGRQLGNIHCQGKLSFTGLLVLMEFFFSPVLKAVKTTIPVNHDIKICKINLHKG